MKQIAVTAVLTACLATASVPVNAQTPPPTGPNATPPGQQPGPVPEEQPVPAKKQPPSKEAQRKEGNETGWTGQQKTDQEQKSDPKRNESQGQPPK